jgi:hypothetical protein
MVEDDLKPSLIREKLFEFSKKLPLDDAELEYQAFASGRIGTRPQICVTFEKINGVSITLSYAHLYSISSECPNAGFMAEFSDHKVIVAGRNLEKLYRYLGDHQARHILQTLDSQSMQLADDQPVVEDLKIIENKFQPDKKIALKE